MTTVAGIPKRIIHVYCPPQGARQELPLAAKAARANAQLLHPDFEHILFGQAEFDEFVLKEFPEFRNTIRHFRYPIQRFDFFRYLAVYRLGGFYFDLDLYLAESLHPLLRHQAVFAFEELTLSSYLVEKFDLDFEVANYAFGAAPQNPFLGAVIENCARGVREPHWADLMMSGIPKWCRGQFEVPMTTGPGMVTRTLAEHPELARNVTILFPPDVRDPAAAQKFGSYGVHLMQGSWRRRDGLLASKLRRMWEVRRRKAFLARSVKLGPTRSGVWKVNEPQAQTANAI